MRLREIEPPSKKEREHRFRLIGVLARKWDKAKLTYQYDDIIRVFQQKYRVKVSYDMVGIAFHGLLYNKPLEVVMNMSRELDKKRERF